MKHQLSNVSHGTKTLAKVCLVTLALTGFALTAYAQQQAYTNKTVNLRAGPAREYPIVQILPTGVGVTVMGCIENFKWCDVAVGDNRGWVYAANIVYAYQGTQVPVLSYGTAIGIGITPFIFDSYWDNYYTSYPWYPQRQYWVNRPRVDHSYRIRRPPVAQVAPVAPRAPVVRTRPNSPVQAPRANPPQQHNAAPIQRPAPSHIQRDLPRAQVSPVRP